MSSDCVLVTGGAGFIGSNFLNVSVARRPDRLFVNVDSLTYAANPENLRALVGMPNYRFERVDIADRESIDAVFERYAPTLVVHFAAETHVDRSIIEPEAFIRTNVIGTFNLLEAFKRRSADQPGALFLHVSTDEVYGSLGPTGRFTEASPYDPSSPYSASKASSDHLVRSYARTYGLPVKITNCSNNYGAFQFPEKLIPLMILNAAARKPLPVYGRGSNVRDWIHVADHCDAIWAVIERGHLGRSYNISGHNELRNIDVVRQICDLVADHVGTAPETLRSLITFVEDRPGHDLRYALDASRLTHECAWSPSRTFEAGLRETVTWYLTNRVWVEHVRSGKYQDWMRTNYEGRAAAD